MIVHLPFTLLVAIGDSANKVFHAGSSWISTSEVFKAWPEFEQMASQANFRAVAALQVRQDGVLPAAAATAIGTELTADGMNWGVNFDATSALANFRYVRFGWLVWVNTGGTAPLFGRCGGRVTITPPAT